jgi:ComF family protein
MLSAFSSLVFPRDCVGCGEALDGGAKKNEWEYLCGDCARELRGVGEEACERCGVPVYGVTTGKRICSVCRESPPVWDEVKCLLRYKGLARGWVRGYKYHDARWVEREWSKLLKAPQYAWLKEFLKDAVLVPVPLHPVRRFLRGFNQAETFSRLLLRVLEPEGALINTKILKRVRWTRQQAKLPRENRLKNVKGAFAVNEGEGGGRKSPRIVVVDDLLTTGATLTVCVQALKKSGFPRVDVLTVARG